MGFLIAAIRRRQSASLRTSVRRLRLGWRTFFRQERPVVAQGVDEEELDAEEVGTERALGHLANLTQVHKVVAQLAFGELVGRDAEMPGQLPDDPDVRVLCALRMARELHVLDHACPEFGHRGILSVVDQQRDSDPAAGNPQDTTPPVPLRRTPVPPP